MPQWNPEQYKKFESERARPFWDLTAKIDFAAVRSMLDIGCGTGDLTRSLHIERKIPRSLGIDSSASMLAEAVRHVTPGLTFEEVSVQDFAPSEKFDLVLSNAALQWVDGHEALFKRILTFLNPGGTLAVQMPVNFDHPSHRLAELIAPEYSLKPRATPVLAPEAYARLLWEAGMREIDVWVQVYLHPLNDAREVVEWTKGTLLTFYQRQMLPERYAEFLAQYTRELVAKTGSGKPYLYTFKRLFLIGTPFPFRK